MRGQMNISPILTAAAIALGMIASMTGAEVTDGVTPDLPDHHADLTGTIEKTDA